LLQPLQHRFKVGAKVHLGKHLTSPRGRAPAPHHSTNAVKAKLCLKGSRVSAACCRMEFCIRN
jgi:hypothetical protein